MACILSKRLLDIHAGWFVNTNIVVVGANIDEIVAQSPISSQLDQPVPDIPSALGDSMTKPCAGREHMGRGFSSITSYITIKTITYDYIDMTPSFRKIIIASFSYPMRPLNGT